ncbi:hypothetical protein JC796_18210 [Delftia acidovorans]|uniref:hypothetical protein n=1 Tax=Delftia acidovorans TaxID=80866 RepID=UPI0018E82B71|nr:hypothetical protein [Delftia acidovorans]MBJ2142678.1 hypothetical protein [Delftia acidovorans]
MSVRAITHLAAAGLAAFLTWNYQGARLGADLAEARADSTSEKLAASTAQRAAEKAINTKYQEALNAARTREALLRRDLDQLRTVSDGLREQSAVAARRLASAAPAAVLEYATAVNELFEQCQAQYAGVAGAADGHAADVQTLTQAWPINERN